MRKRAPCLILLDANESENKKKISRKKKSEISGTLPALSSLIKNFLTLKILLRINVLKGLIYNKLFVCDSELTKWEVEKLLNKIYFTKLLVGCYNIIYKSSAKSSLYKQVKSLSLAALNLLFSFSAGKFIYSHISN